MVGKHTYCGGHLLLFTLILSSGLFLSCSRNEFWDDHYGNTPEASQKNVLSLLAENPDYSSFYNAVLTYGYEELLRRNQYFTIFVPSNKAFENIPQYSEQEWKRIIAFHIVYSNLYSRNFGDLDLMSVAGKYLNMRRSGTSGFQISGASISMDKVDNTCQNSILHEIDKLLVPQPNIYEFILDLDADYSIFREFIRSMDIKSIDFDKSVRIGVNDNGDAIYDTIWKIENYYLDQIAGLDKEELFFTGFIPSDDDVRSALNSLSEYFGDYRDLDEKTYNQVLFIAFSGCFIKDKYTTGTLPDTLVSVTGKRIESSSYRYAQANVETSNGMIHLLDGLPVPKSFFLLPITIEADRKENRRVSNTMYNTELLSDTRATNGSYFLYGCQFVGDYLEFTVDIVLKTTYWFTWTGPKQGPSHYQVFIKDDDTGEFINIGPPVNNWTKPAWKPVVSGSYTFKSFGTKTVRFVIVNELPLPGYNSIYLDYIKLTPDEIYIP